MTNSIDQSDPTEQVHPVVRHREELFQFDRNTEFGIIDPNSVVGWGEQPTMVGGEEVIQVLILDEVDRGCQHRFRGRSPLKQR